MLTNQRVTSKHEKGIYKLSSHNQQENKSGQINKADNCLSKSEIRSISIFFFVPQLTSYQKAKVYWGHVWNKLSPDLTYVAFHPSSDVSLSVLNLTTIDPLVATGWGAVRPQNLPLLVPFTDPSNIETESYWQLLPAAKEIREFRPFEIGVLKVWLNFFETWDSILARARLLVT